MNHDGDCRVLMMTRNASLLLVTVDDPRNVTLSQTRRSVGKSTDLSLLDSREIAPTTLRERPAHIPAPVPPSGLCERVMSGQRADQTGFRSVIGWKSVTHQRGSLRVSQRLSQRPERKQMELVTIDMLDGSSVSLTCDAWHTDENGHLIVKRVNEFGTYYVKSIIANGTWRAATADFEVITP